MSEQTNTNTDGPLIGPEQSLPEMTRKVIVLSLILTVVLAAANAYLGLKVGTTVSSSIPAAVISMGVLRFFKKHNVIENNMVQTAASVGEALTAGIAFILPALLILHYWTHFDYWSTAVIGLVGGVLGVLLTVPLRRTLIKDPSLPFPEGTAIGHVLAASANKNADIKPLVYGSIVGAVIALFQTGFRVLSDSWEFWTFKKNTVVGFGLGFSPALIAAGYIVGPTIAFSLLAGIVVSWVCALHIISVHFPHQAGQSAVDVAMNIWNTRLRFLGVGAMLVGGLWTLFTLFKPVLKGIQKSIASLRHVRSGRGKAVLRTEKDISIDYVACGLIAVLVAAFFVLFALISPASLGISTGFHWFLCILDTFYVLVAGFVFSAVSAYFAGLIGSTNNPASGLMIAALLILSLILLSTLYHAGIAHSHAKSLVASAMAIMTVAILGASITLANDTMQDLKAGYMVGATPWKQQVMLLFGVLVASLIVPPVLELLFNAYGMGGIYPRPGMDPSQMLAAPQAGLMAAVTQGVFSHDLPWSLIIAGMMVAVVCIIVDEFLKKRGKRLPVLAVGLGMYLPLDASVPVVIGGLLRLLVRSMYKRRHRLDESHEEAQVHLHRGLILACGLVAGAALMGVILAIPFAIAKNSDALRLVPHSFTSIANWLSVLVTIAMCYWIYHSVVRKE